jgi:hypothetical protein
MVASSDPVEVTKVSPNPSPVDEKVDTGTSAELLFPNDVTASLYCNFEHPSLLGITTKTDVTVSLEGGSITLTNFPGPHLYHRIKIQETQKGGASKNTSETMYTFKDGDKKGEDYWTT